MENFHIKYYVKVCFSISCMYSKQITFVVFLFISKSSFENNKLNNIEKISS